MLLKCVLIYLRAYKIVHTNTSLRARCMQVACTFVTVRVICQALHFLFRWIRQIFRQTLDQVFVPYLDYFYNVSKIIFQIQIDDKCQVLFNYFLLGSK